jgi:hypothetical protein
MMDTYESTIAVAIAEGEAGGDCPSNRARSERGADVLTADDVGRAAVGFLKVTKLMTLWLAII